MDVPFKTDETIVRVLYFPNHIHNDKKRVKKAAFRTPADIDEVSVIRHSLTTSTFCKQWGKKHESDKRTYFGVAALKVLEITGVGASIEHTPIIPENPYHADIKIGYVPKKGEELPPEKQLIVDELAEKARLYEDPDTTAEEWTGGVIS